MTFDEALACLAELADAADSRPDWPTASWQVVADAGVSGWAVPTEFGGAGLAPLTLLENYERLAGACLTTAFILSQRDAAVRRIRDAGRDDLSRELLRPLACGGRFATVGLSQLTTSRQHLGPSLRAPAVVGGFVLDGLIPWVTGADEAHHLVAGAVLDDDRQILLAVPGDAPGLSVKPPLDLMALVGSRTAEVECAHVFVDERWLLAGPVEKVMSVGRGGTGGLETSCLAIGHGGAAVEDLRCEAEARSEWREPADRLDATRLALRTELHRLATEGGSSEDAMALRAKANAFVLRATQAALAACKGAGFVRPHPAQRRARQALFFLVWSCPRPALEATMAELQFA